MIAGNDIHFGSLVPLISTTIAGSSIFTISGNDTNINASSMINGIGTVRIVVDNNNCCPNTLPTCRISSSPGIVNMDAAAAITGSAIQIYMADQGTSILNGTLNGVVYGTGAFPPGTPFVDTAYEQWCSCCGCFGCTGVRIGSSNPFTLFYKPCLPLVVYQATIIDQEFLADLHPANEFPGWMVRFLVSYREILGALDEEPYYLRRRQTHVNKHPKSWTMILY